MKKKKGGAGKHYGLLFFLFLLFFLGKIISWNEKMEQIISRTGHF